MRSTFKSEVLFELVRRRCPEKAQDWFDRVLLQPEGLLDRNRFGIAYAGVRRRLGYASVTLDREEKAALQLVALSALNGLLLDELCRVALLLRATEGLPASEHVSFIDEVYRHGDNHERQMLLRSLNFLPEPERFLTTAVEACRTNVQTIFEAIACDNPYPFHYFPELNFNQMVLKALFIGAPLRRVLGLQERITPQLLRMAEDYASERRAAGRPVPQDMGLITKNTRSAL